MLSTNRVYGLLFITTIFWAIQPLCVKIIVANWSPAALTGFRYLLISAILFAVMYVQGERRLLPPKKLWLPLILMGLTGIAINNVAQFTGLRYSTVTNVTLIGATGPAVTALLAYVLIRERLNKLQWLGIIISFVGVVLLITRGSMEVVENCSFNIGDILFFICQCAWAIYSIIGLKVMQQISAIKATAWAGFLGAMEVLIYGFFTHEIVVTPLPMDGIISFAFTVIFGGAMAMVFWNVGVKVVGPAIAVIFFNLTPIFGMIVGHIALEEPIGLLQIGGAIIIFTGVYITTQTPRLLAKRQGRKETARSCGDTKD